jgi:hypothetical protein
MVPSAYSGAAAGGASAGRQNLMQRAMGFAKSNTGQTLLGNALQGYDEGRRQDDVLDYYRERDDRVEATWRDFDPSSVSFDNVNVPPGMLSNAMNAVPRGQMTYAPQDPLTVATYAAPQ